MENIGSVTEARASTGLLCGLFRAAVSGPAGPAMAGPLFLPRTNFFTILSLSKSSVYFHISEDKAEQGQKREHDTAKERLLWLLVYLQDTSFVAVYLAKRAQMSLP